MESARVALVRDAYRRFNKSDITALLDLLDPDVELPDPLSGRKLRGVDEAREYWEREFALVEPTLLVSEIVEIGDALLVVVFQELYDRESGKLLGHGVTAVHRVTFRGDRIASIEYTGIDEVPEQIRQRLA